MTATPEEEAMARAACIALRIDPDARGHGMGMLMPKDAEYALWEAQLPVVRAILASDESR